MQRSMKLGHCICNPRQNCPCSVFKEQDICPCAGEKADTAGKRVKLTSLTEKPGCASKIDQAFLKRALSGLPRINDPRVLVGVPAGDDAGVYDIGNGVAIVQTVDVFTPCVDDAYTFGQIAAANSLSDIYAMGGTPMTALSIIGFPVGRVAEGVMSRILCGGIEKMNEAGTAVIGGHSINDTDIKAGFAVTGTIRKSRIVTNAGARPGDALILTKPLGTGIISFASQLGRASRQAINASAKSMTALNRRASELMLEYGAHACTDVTGFGLMGHLCEMAQRSGCDVEITWDDIPLLPGVLQYAADGILPGAIERNRESCGRQVIADRQLRREMADICFDAQTSGGLLIAIPEKRVGVLLAALQKGGTCAAIIGHIAARGRGVVRLKTTGRRKTPGQRVSHGNR